MSKSNEDRRRFLMATSGVAAACLGVNRAFAQVQESPVIQPPMPRLELLSRATVSIDRTLTIGPTPTGERRIVPILGGRLEGRLNAEIIPGGADWQIIAADGTGYLEARYTVRTSEGALIYVRNIGVRHGPADVLAQLASGEPVDPTRYYFRSTPSFETADPGYAWLNKIITVCSGARTVDSVLLDFYEVL